MGGTTPTVYSQFWGMHFANAEPRWHELFQIAGGKRGRTPEVTERLLHVFVQSPSTQHIGVERCLGVNPIPKIAGDPKRPNGEPALPVGQSKRLENL